MCGICGSYNIETFKKLVKQNLERGNYSHSFTVYDDLANQIVQVIQSFNKEEIDKHLDDLYISGDLYYIGHTQAPTGGIFPDFDRIHPHICNTPYWDYTRLWHNGIILNDTIKKYNMWDTGYLHGKIHKFGFNGLNDVKGSFACCYYEPFDIFIFRNSSAPLYVNGTDFSSSQFENSEMIKSGVVYKLCVNKFQETQDTFKTDDIYNIID